VLDDLEADFLVAALLPYAAALASAGIARALRRRSVPPPEGPGGDGA
jgi:hypothetical protein